MKPLREHVDDELLSGTVTERERRMPSGLSPSSIDLYHQCPRKFEWEKVDGNYGGTGEAAVKGTFVHRVLELLMQHDPDDRTPDMARLHMGEAFNEMLVNDEFRSLSLPDDEVRDFRRDAWTSVRRYFEMEDPRSINVVSTEEYVEAEVEGVPLRGIIDRLEYDMLDDLVVTDYKNGKVPLPRYRAPKMRQLNLYAALVEASRGERPVAGRLVFTAFGEVIDTNFTDESVGAAVEDAMGVWAAAHDDYRDGEFAPNPGPLCGWCPVVAECAEGKKDILKRAKGGRLGDHAPAWDIVPELVEIRESRRAKADFASDESLF